MALSLLEHLEQYRINDRECSAAYERVGAVRRSRLKQNIAWNAALCGGSGGDTTIVRVSRSRGGAFLTDRRPLDWTLVLVENRFLAPGPIVSASVYPLLAGVREVAVLREAGDAPFPDGMLAGLELAGVECFGECVLEDMAEAVRRSQGVAGRGMILVPGRVPAVVEQAAESAGASVQPLGRGSVPVIHILCDSASTWDWEFLSWAYPGATFVIGGAGAGTVQERLSGAADCMICSSELLFSRECDLFLHPDPAAVETVPARLCLGPGQEGAWIWPQMSPEMFQYVSIRLFS